MKQIIRWLAGWFGMVAIDWQSAEYLTCLSGQIPWGNQTRRAHACADLSQGMLNQPMNTSLECFDSQKSPWEITIATKRK